MYISLFRILLIILSAMVAGMNIFNILSAIRNGESMQMPVLTFVAMLVLILGILSSQYFQNKKNNSVQ